MKACLIILSVLITSFCYCQNDEGYEDGVIISKTGDTTRCLIGLGIQTPYPGKISFKQTPGGKVSLISLKDIHAIQTAYLYLENIRLHKKEILMVRIVHGNTQLFSHTTYHQKMTSVPYGPTYMKSDQPTIIYAVVKAGQIQEISRKSFKETAWFLFKDCPYVTESILKKKNRYEDMERIVIQYNTCK